MKDGDLNCRTVSYKNDGSSLDEDDGEDDDDDAFVVDILDLQVDGCCKRK
jgi:hypothetical protein